MHLLSFYLTGVPLMGMCLTGLYLVVRASHVRVPHRCTSHEDQVSYALYLICVYLTGIDLLCRYLMSVDLTGVCVSSAYAS